MTDTVTDPGWKNALESYMSSESSSSSSFPQLDAFLQQEYDTYGEINIYPPRHEIFNALNLCPLHKVKVVIVGQDPYHGPKQAMGLSFSVNHGIAVPPSLRNIFKEIQTDMGADPQQQAQQQQAQQQAQHGDLVGWAQQGVLLLNTVLTVRCREANSHKNQGWEQLTDEIVRIVLTRKLEENTTTTNNNGTSTSNGLVFLLWGGPATKKAQAIIAQQNSDASIDETVLDNKNKKNTNVVVITTSHPSPLGATKTKTPFLGSNCFSRTNAALQEMGLDPIDWYQR